MSYKLLRRMFIAIYHKIPSFVAIHPDSQVIGKLDDSLKNTESIDPKHNLNNVGGKMHGGLMLTQENAILRRDSQFSETHNCIAK